MSPRCFSTPPTEEKKLKWIKFVWCLNTKVEGDIVPSFLELFLCFVYDFNYLFVLWKQPKPKPNLVLVRCGYRRNWFEWKSREVWNLEKLATNFSLNDEKSNFKTFFFFFFRITVKSLRKFFGFKSNVKIRLFFRQTFSAVQIELLLFVRTH